MGSYDLRQKLSQQYYVITLNEYNIKSTISCKKSYNRDSSTRGEGGGVTIKHFIINKSIGMINNSSNSNVYLNYIFNATWSCYCFFFLDLIVLFDIYIPFFLFFYSSETFRFFFSWLPLSCSNRYSLALPIYFCTFAISFQPVFHQQFFNLFAFISLIILRFRINLSTEFRNVIYE